MEVPGQDDFSITEHAFAPSQLQDLYSPSLDVASLLCEDDHRLQQPSNPAHDQRHVNTVSALFDQPVALKSNTKCLEKLASKRQRDERIAFLVETEMEQLDDGYKWRKYGDKTVKQSPYRRKYYRCSNARCLVKKHVERCATHPQLLVLTYEGQHNHHSHVLVNGAENAFIVHPILVSSMGSNLS